MLEQYANNIILNSIEENKDKLDNSKISVIHPEISIKYSSTKAESFSVCFTSTK